MINPAGQTPLTTLALAEILAEAGLPDGVVNVITTSSSGGGSAPIIADPRLRKLTFTGSTSVGQRVDQAVRGAGAQDLHGTGREAPFLVFADADLDAAVDGAMLAKMRNIGEACTAANRSIVHESVAEEFAARFAAKMGDLTVGRGNEDGVKVGPLIDQAAIDKVTELVADAVDHGAEVLTGGKVLDGRPLLHPDRARRRTHQARIFREEIFGPVAPVSTFADDDEGLAMANDTEFGLVAYAFTQNLSRAIRVAEGLQTGMVGINQGIVSNPAAPFGGVKASGWAARAAPRASRNTWRPSTSASNSDRHGIDVGRRADRSPGRVDRDVERVDGRVRGVPNRIRRCRSPPRPSKPSG